jgi:hypothetical protein
MSEEITCKEMPIVRYTWPGRDESFACEKHARGIQAVSEAIGTRLQMIALSAEDQLKVACASKDAA